MDNEDLRKIQNYIGYKFKNLDLLQQAFVRRSYAKENGGEDNEVLEFIGDKVLDIIVVKILVEEFGFYTSECDDYDKEEDFNEFCCEYSEGKLTEMKKRLVSKRKLADCIDQLGVADYLIMGKGDGRNHIEQEDSVKEDLFEAIIGAVTLDSRWDWKEMQSVVEYMLQPRECLSEDEEDNYVKLIQEWALRRYGNLPRPSVRPVPVARSIPLNKIIKRFKPSTSYSATIDIRTGHVYEKNKINYECDLTFPEINVIFIGEGRSKNEARQLACEGAYNYLEEHGHLFSIRDEIENPNKADAINQLEILARRGYFSIPTYEFEQSHDKGGNPIWKCECHIAEYDTFFWAESSSKKDAKKTAAFEMLKYVLAEEE